MTLIAALLCVTLLLGLSGALVLTTVSETQVAAAYETGTEALHAAEAAAEYAIHDLSSIADWARVVDGSQLSTFTDGPAGGSRVLADSSVIDLGSLGPGTFRLFVYGPLAGMSPGRIDSRMYVAVWVAAAPPPLSDAVVLEAHAYGPRGARRMLQVTVDRDRYGHVRPRAWRELHQ